LLTVRVAVLGAGGLGSYLGARLMNAGYAVTLVARGPHLEAMRGDGLLVATDAGEALVRPQAVRHLSDADPADVVLLTPKTTGLDEAARTVAAGAPADSTVVPLTNGVEALDRLALGGVGRGRVVEGVAYVTAFRTAPGIVHRQGSHGRVVVGASAPESSGRTGMVASLLRDAGLQVEVSTDIEGASWGKMALVCGLVSGCALLGADMGPVRRHPDGPGILGDAIREVGLVARTRGVSFDDAAEEHVMGVLAGFPDDFHPSLIHDLNSGRPTEIDALNGAIVRMGREAGIQTPVAAATVRAIAQWGKEPPGDPNPG
jgi:2-dehydropantoate 2-reductase